MKLTYHFQTIKELTYQTGLTYDQVRYRVNKMVKEGKAEKLEAAGNTYYRLTAATPLTINDSYELAQTYTFNVFNKQDKDLFVHFAASYRTDRKNAQVAISKFRKGLRQEAFLYGLSVTK